MGHWAGDVSDVTESNHSPPRRSRVYSVGEAAVANPHVAGVAIKEVDGLPRSTAATSDQYPVCTSLLSLPQPSRHSTPYRSDVPSSSDQKLKLRDEMKNIQFRQLCVDTLDHENGSSGQIWSGWVRHVRGT